MRYPLNRKGEPSFAPQAAFLALVFGAGMLAVAVISTVTGRGDAPLWFLALSLLMFGYGVGFFARGGE